MNIAVGRHTAIVPVRARVPGVYSLRHRGTPVRCLNVVSAGRAGGMSFVWCQAPRPLFGLRTAGI